MDLFEYAKSKTLDRESPLASRLRPTKRIMMSDEKNKQEGLTTNTSINIDS